MTQTTTKTSWDAVRWNLTDIYTSENDPQLQTDLTTLQSMMATFQTTHQGNLSQTIPQALEDLARIKELQNKVWGFLLLQTSIRSDDEALKKIESKTTETLMAASAKHLTFFEHEVANIPTDTLENLYQTDATVAHHKPYLSDLRENAKYLLAENVEQALATRTPFGPMAWDDFNEEHTTSLRFNWNGEEKNLEEMLSLISSSTTQEDRITAQKTINEGLKSQGQVRLTARALNVTIGAKRVEDEQRGYQSPMHARNLENQVDEATVQALHTAVKETAAPLAEKFYKLKAKILGIEKLHWADRNAPVPFEDDTIIEWADGFSEVKEAFKNFSPTLYEEVLKLEKNKRIDAPIYPGKRGGAFNFHVPIAGGQVLNTVLLNHNGKRRDYMTLAHELGHAVHSQLAVKAQGTLQERYPMVYAETASIFAEMLLFDRFKKSIKNKEDLITLLLNRCNDFTASVVHQIFYSDFEQSIHAQRANGSLTQEDFNHTWKKTAQTYYGDSLRYEDMEHSWAYVHHFFSPFYVYSYAFGELFTQALYAVKDDFGDDFEPLYRNLLAAGGTKDAVALMQPFGLNPNDPDFWQRGISSSLNVWLDELEELIAKP